jgi:gas vesicle protein
MNTSSKIVTGFITGTFFGAAVALLYAPKKGMKTRKMLGTQAKAFSDVMEKNYTHARQRLGLDRKLEEKVLP